jgi:GT2 family glycosyltransferase
MLLQRVAVIFDNQVRPDTTGGYCLRALQELVTVEHFLPAQIPDIPRGQFDLYVNIDDSFQYRLPADLRPAAWWAIDTHLNLPWYLTKAPDFNVVFTAQRDGPEQLRQHGIEPTIWLPLACDPAIHQKYDVPKVFDVCFVGHLFKGPRTELVRLLQEHFPRSFVGQRFFAEMARVYSEARAVFNRSLKNDINMRVFEALACGSLLLTNDLAVNGQDELFRDGVHLATYRDADELLDKLRYYLDHEAIRERIAAAGRAEALAKHTYRQRMERLLQEAEHVLAMVRATVPPGIAADGPAQECPTSPSEVGAPKVVPEPAGNGVGARHVKAQATTGVAVAVAAAPSRQASGARSLPTGPDAMPQPTGAASPGEDAIDTASDPVVVLRQRAAGLRPGAELRVQLPNLRHHRLIQGLLDGHWRSGRLMHPGPRFTRREIEKLFYRAGLEITELSPAPGPEYEHWQQQGGPGEVRVGNLHIESVPPEEAGEFFTSHFRVRAVPAAPAPSGLTSIVIVTHNEWAYTQRCLQSIRRCTDEPYELIFVDNGSTDGTREFLGREQDARVLLNDANRGFPAAANQGMRAATGQQILLLNNDTVLTTGWLKRQLQALYSDPQIGMVGPCSNLVSGEQQVSCRYDAALLRLDGFAWEWGKANDRRMVDAERLVGFCLLIRREVIERVGFLDERFGIGCFEDDDYSRRVRQAGYRLVIARDAFVHHFCGKTFIGAGIDYDHLLQTNRALYRQKWEPVTSQAAAPSLTVPASPRGIPAATVRVLLVAHVERLRSRLDKSHYYRYEALAARPGVRLFGPGMTGYRAGMSVQAAITVACGGHPPDILVHGADLKESCTPLVTGLDRAGVLTALELLDSWARPERQVAFIRQQRFALGLIQEAGPHLAFYQSHCPETEFIWTPNAVNTHLFHDYHQPKEYDVLLYGMINAEVYPLRTRLAQLLPRQRDLRFRHILHPGYYPSRDGPLAEVLAGADLSREINKAWIGLVSRSVYHCLLMKYLEIPASYTAVAGDMPEWGRPLFGNDFIELGMEQSDADIMTTLRAHLADKDRLRAMTEVVHQRVMREHSTEAFADRLLGRLEGVIQTRRAGTWKGNGT